MIFLENYISKIFLQYLLNGGEEKLTFLINKYIQIEVLILLGIVVEL